MYAKRAFVHRYIRVSTREGNFSKAHMHLAALGEG